MTVTSHSSHGQSSGAGNPPDEECIVADSQPINSDDLPAVTYTGLLGVTIQVNQEAIWADVYEGGHTGGFNPEVSVEAWDGDYVSGWTEIKADLSAWARRNLFSGAGR